jgi:hypothetical protein
MSRNYQFLIDLAIGVVLMLTLNMARSVWRSADNPPSSVNPPNEPLA